MTFFHLVCKVLTENLIRFLNSVKAETFWLLPVLCVNESNELEPTLTKDCANTLACLSVSFMPPQVLVDSVTFFDLPNQLTSSSKKVMPSCLDAIESVAKSSSWKAKRAVLEFLQASLDPKQT